MNNFCQSKIQQIQKKLQFQSIITLCLIGLVLSNDLTAQTNIKYFQEQKQHPITQAVLGLAELASQTKDFDFQQLFVALDELADSFKQRQIEENQLYETDYTSYLADQQYYNNQITEFQNQIAGLEVEISSLTSEKENSEEYLKAKKQDLYDTVRLLNAKQSQISSDSNTFNKQYQDYTDAIQVLDKATELLNEVKQDASSLIQKKDHFKQTGDKLHHHFKKMSSTRVFYQPLVKMMISLSQDNYVDQENLNKVLTFIANLRQSLVDAQISLHNDFTNQQNGQKKIESELQNKVDELKNNIIPSTQTDITTKEGELRALKQILAEAQQNLADANDSLKATEDRWIVRTQAHRTLLQTYDNELLVIKEAENSLKKGGIFRQ
ncbi:hypothetical protein pb186bvf_001383 [Paramecium bursaria]